MQLTVHIGTTKTGTSSIQRYLHDSREDLLNQGVLVPVSLGRPIHTNAVVAALPFGKSADLSRLIPVRDIPEHDRFRRKTSDEYRAELKEHLGSSQTIISAEFLHSRVVEQEDIASFKSLFCSGFDDVRVVVYVRPQLDHVTSLYSTVLKAGGHKGSLEKFIIGRMEPRQLPYYDIKDIISRWGREFGLDNVIVRPYKGVTGAFGVVEDFCDTVGIRLDAARLEGQAKENRSLSAEGQELIRMINRGTEDSELRRKVVAWAEKNCAGRGAQPSLAVATKFQELFAESNEWVIANYFPENPEYLEPRWPDA